VVNGAVDILVIEDSASESASIVASLEAEIPDVRVALAHDGEDAMNFLFCRGRWTARKGEGSPKLILLDLSLSDSHGFSVLAQIRSLEMEESLTLTPVVIFTDSYAQGDIKESYRCGANSYIIKPLSFTDFNRVVRSVGQYWMSLNHTVH
jgi:two-component system response regulator